MEYKVGDCFTYIRNGANIKQDKLAGGIPITRIETLSNDTFNRDKMGYAGIQNYEKYKSYLLQDGDILMSHINSARFLGRAVVYHKEGHEKIIHGMNLLLLKARLDIINPEYAVLVFKSEIFKRALQKIIKKSVNQASFAVSDLKKLKIEVPVLSEQEKIVEEFYKLNRILKSRTKELNTFDELVKARFVEMFDQPNYYNDKVTAIPLPDICKIIDGDRGKAYPKQEDFMPNGYCLFLNAKNVTSTGFNFENKMFISPAKDKELRKGKLAYGDIVLTTRGTIGNLAFYDKKIPYENMRINSGMVILKLDFDKLNERFFMEQFKMQLPKILENISSGTAQPQLPILSMKKIKIRIPPKTLQDKFAEFCIKVDKSKVAIQKSLDETQTLMDSLMQKYFG